MQVYAIEVFLPWIKWAVMSRILPQGSSEFVFFCRGEASASQLPRVIFSKILSVLNFVRPDAFQILFFGIMFVFEGIELCARRITNRQKNS